MNKLYRGFIRLIQSLNYFVFKSKVEKKNNLFSNIETHFQRLTADFSKDLSRGIRINKCFPAGKTIDIDLREERVTVEVLYRCRRILDNMDNMGTSGVDIYVQVEDGNFVWRETIAPNNNYQMYVKKNIILDKGLKRIKIYLPSFAIVKGIFIKSDVVERIYVDKSIDIIVYGSSITHGCAASRPGLNYVNQLSRQLKRSVGNYGFSESAKGEEKLLDYISKIPSKIFILEYDHNASVEELCMTYKKAYKTIRGNFKGWIIMMSRFSGGLSISLEEESLRVSIIKETYDYAVKNGDHKVFYYNGTQLFGNEKNKYFVDRVHPNDFGMTAISKMLCSIIREERMLE